MQSAHMQSVHLLSLMSVLDGFDMLLVLKLLLHTGATMQQLDTPNEGGGGVWGVSCPVPSLLNSISF